MGSSGQNGTVPQGMEAYKPPHLLQPHRARQAFRDAHEGKIPPLIGYYCGFASPPVSKLVAQLGYDLVWIDWEHSAMNTDVMDQMVQNIQFISGGKTHALVRVPGHDHAAIGYALDAGASIVVPQVDTVEQAQHIVSAAKFGSRVRGTRSAPPGRWLPGCSDSLINPEMTIWENLNDQAAIVIQIESLRGIKNLDAILTECGEYIDSVWLGSLDARASMSLPGFAGAEPEWLEAVAEYTAVLKKHDKPSSGFALGDVETKKALGKGRSFLVVAADFFSLLQVGTTELMASRETFPVHNYSADNMKN